MKRDMELVRKIALAIEAEPNGYALRGVTVDGYTDEQIAYHSHLMLEHGLAKGVDVSHMGGTSPMAQLTALTWAGHEFAESARNDAVWRKAMTTVQEKGGAITLSVLTELLKKLMRDHFGL